MIIRVGTTFSPDTEGLDYDKKSAELAQQIIANLPNTSIYNPTDINADDFHDRAFVILPKYLRARDNSTKGKRTLVYFLAQSRKRHVDLILLTPWMSSVNYSDNRIDDYVDIHIIGEQQLMSFIRWVKGDL